MQRLPEFIVCPEPECEALAQINKGESFVLNSTDGPIEFAITHCKGDGIGAPRHHLTMPLADLLVHMATSPEILVLENNFKDGENY